MQSIFKCTLNIIRFLKLKFCKKSLRYFFIVNIFTKKNFFIQSINLFLCKAWIIRHYYLIIIRIIRGSFVGHTSGPPWLLITCNARYFVKLMPPEKKRFKKNFVLIIISYLAIKQMIGRRSVMSGMLTRYKPHTRTNIKRQYIQYKVDDKFNTCFKK